MVRVCNSKTCKLCLLALAVLLLPARMWATSRAGEMTASDGGQADGRQDDVKIMSTAAAGQAAVIALHT